MPEKAVGVGEAALDGCLFMRGSREGLVRDKVDGKGPTSIHAVASFNSWELHS